MSRSRLPVLFIGHGNPMNAITDNPFTQVLRRLGREISRPRAVLCVSAHWMTEGTWITHGAQPRTIHDFYGFPRELSQIQYPAPGDPARADEIRGLARPPEIQADDEQWGFDHGSWAVLRHLYPEADVPVLQLSLDMAQPAEFHFTLGQKLALLREQGVLIVGSGNLVHNLRKIKWEADAPAYDWAIEFDEWVKGRLKARDFKALVSHATETEAGRLSIPTLDHWYPFLYALGAADPQETMRFEYEGIENASISMRLVSWGMK